jgi:predicted nucleic acid-binding protein
MNYWLDLDTVSALSEPTSPYHKTVKSHVKHLSEKDTVYLSILSIYELRYSISNTEDEDKISDILQLIQWCKKFFEILPLSEAGAVFYGELKAGLKSKTGMNRKAIKKHNIDLMLAATALDCNCVLVAKDGIYKDHLVLLNRQLMVEDWTQCH